VNAIIDQQRQDAELIERWRDQWQRETSVAEDYFARLYRTISILARYVTPMFRR
jgi:hypothetical protein